jgi:S1-C subfamily serine protease
MKSRRSCILSLAVCCFGGLIAASSSDSQLPSISELEKLTFTADTVSASSALPHAEVFGVRNLFLAYGAGAKAVAQYRDPVLTRGAQGEEIFRSVSPSVVAVVVGSINKDNNFDPEGLGTGAIVDTRGYVLTNWHVINGYRGALVFLKPTGNPDLATAEAFGAKVIYQDSTVDLALLKMIDPPKTLHALQLAEISHVQVAEDIHIIGHPHGNFWSYSTGVVSQIRDGYTWSYHDGSNHTAKVLQLQTAINPGNSGGPVVDDSGNILGLVAMSEEGQNLNYAIAADVIKSFLATGMQMNPRGAQASASSSPPQQLLSGKLSDAMPVSKAVYADAVLYEVRRPDGTSLGVVAKFSDGMVLSAWQPDMDGNFRSWSANLPDGRHLVATASNGFLSGISQAQTAEPHSPVNTKGAQK